jgi:hypothetical protein
MAVGVILSLEERDEATRVHREARRGSGTVNWRPAVDPALMA